VSDSGIGIPKMMRDRVFDRFYRVPGSEQVGSGLGLSIVKRVTEIHDGDIIIGEADIGGASITVKLSKS
jgi:signal transduction histidine kinase